MKKVLYTILLCFVASTQLLATELNTWTHYFAYDKLTHVVPTKDYIFAISAGRLFSYAPGKAIDSQIYAYNTTNLLSDHNDIQDILYVQATNTLVVIYEGGNIDLLDIAKSKVTNISYIKDYNTTHSKKILDACCNGKDVYITMPWNIVIINTQNKEITENYVITEDESNSNTIFGSIIQGDSIFVAASSNIPGYQNTVICGNLRSNLLDKKSWSDKLASNRTQALCDAIKNNKQSRNIYTLNNPDAKHSSLIRDSFRDCYWGSNGDNLLMEYNKEGSQYEPVLEKAIKPAGPASNDFRTIYWKHNKLYTVGGTWTRFDDLRESNVIQTMHLKSGIPQWQLYNPDVTAVSEYTMYGAADISIDPRDTTHVMVASRSGLYEFRKGEIVKVWNNTNSPIKALQDGDSYSYQMVLGAQYDSNGNLYVLNSYCSNGLLCLDNKGEWKTIHSTYLDNFTSNVQFLSNIRFDNNGSLWFINQNRDNNTCFYKFDTWTETVIKYNVSKNQDGSIVYEDFQHLRDINVDMDGNVWTAGTKGITYKPYDKTNTELTYQYKVNRNDGTGLADYLLSTINASCIIFDTANRMYVGTSGNGIYVISADRNTEVQHYTTENSNVMSDNIFGLAIDNNSGELYISTEKGLCSLHTDAIQVPESLEKDNIVVYPNPVTPEYTGPISIEGLTVGASIIITNTAGAVVHRGRTTSAMYQWDGCDIKGDRCASGVYNILLAGKDGSKGCVGKIAMVK